MSWNCTLCTFQNHGEKYCTMCGKSRPVQSNVAKQQKQSQPPSFEAHMSLSEAQQLCVYDKIDHRSDKFLYGTVSEKKGTKLKIHYDGWSQKWDVWSDYSEELQNFAKAGSISRRPAHRLTDLKQYGFVKVNPKRTRPGCNWIHGEIKRLDPKSGQVLVAYRYHSKDCSYWTHFDDTSEISESTLVPLIFDYKYSQNTSNTKSVTVNLTEYCPIKILLNMDKNQRMIIKNVKIANLKWNIIIFPNGNIMKYNKETFIIGLDLFTMPSEWKEIILCQTVEFVEKKKIFVGINKYDQQSGWQKRVILLSKLKDLKPSQICIKISMNILSVFAKKDSNILYQFNDKKCINKFINNSSKKFVWNFDNEMIDNFIKADHNKMKPFLTSPSNDGMWQIECDPNEDNDVWSQYNLHLCICYLPPNVKALQVKFYIKCREINAGLTTTHSFSYDDGRYWSSKIFRRPEIKQLLSALSPLKLECDINILSVTTNDGQTMSFENWKKYFMANVLGNSEKYGIRDYEKLFGLKDNLDEKLNDEVEQHIVDTLRDEKNAQNNNEEKQEMDNKMNEETNGTFKQFEKFLAKHRLEKYFKSFQENECADIRDIKYLIDDEFLQNDIKIKLKIHRKKFIVEATELTKQMESFKNAEVSLIPSMLTQKLGNYGVVTMDILFEEVKNQSDLHHKFNINEKECDLLWNVVQNQRDMNQQEGLQDIDANAINTAYNY